MTQKIENPQMASGGLEKSAATFDESHGNYSSATPDEMQGLDMRPALVYAERLTGAVDGMLTFSAFCPGKEAKIWRGSVAQAWDKIRRLQDDGYGTYITVNQTRGCSRKKEDITAIRAVWVDADKAAPIRESWPLPPHLIVESSPGKFHYYWLISAGTLVAPDEFEAVNRTLCAAHPDIGGDTNAMDISRVLRLPGTLHLKDKSRAHLVRIVYESPSKTPYTWEKIIQAFPPTYALPNNANPRFDFDAALQTIRGAGEGLHAALRDVAAHCASIGMERDVAQELIAGYAESRSDGSPRYKERISEIPRLVESAYQKFSLLGFDNGAAQQARGPLNLFTCEHQVAATFDPKHYPAVIANLAADIALRMGCDPLVPAWTALVAVAGLVPDAHALQVKAKDHTWRESPRLWAAVIGDPSTQKSPPMSAVLAPIESMQREYAEQHAAEIGQWRELTALAKKNKEAEPDTPQMRRLLAHDATTEALALVLQANPAGMLVAQDELSSWFGSHDAYRPTGTAKDRGFWLQAYNGAPYTVDRVKGSIFIPNLSVSIIGGIQPAPMRELAAKIGDDGLLQRFICIPIRAVRADTDTAPDTATITAWRALVEELADLRNDKIMWPELFRLSSAAQVKLDDARQRIREIAASPANDKRIIAALGKGAGQLARLVVIFHLIENRGGEDLFCIRNVPAEIIDESTTDKAIRLFFDLVIPATFDFYARVIGESERQQQARRVASYILAHECQTISDRDIYREALKELRDDERGRAEVMRQLELAGWIAPKREMRGRVVQWDVSPAVHIKFAAQAAVERERRARVVSEIRGSVSSDNLDIP